MRENHSRLVSSVATSMREVLKFTLLFRWWLSLAQFSRTFIATLVGAVGVSLPSQIQHDVHKEYMSPISAIWKLFSVSSTWFMQTASIQRVTALVVSRRAWRAEDRFLVTGWRWLERVMMGDRVLGGPQTYERAM